MKITILGLSLTSSWGNGHATTYRSLIRSLHEHGHDVLFLERDQPWYAENRDLPEPSYGRVALYYSLDDLFERFEKRVAESDLVIVGSYVPEGMGVIDWVVDTARGVTAFYDIDTPITLANVRAQVCEYLEARQIPEFDVYLSFTAGPILARLESDNGARRARALYCSVDPSRYFPEHKAQQWKMGYLGTWSEDRQPALEECLLEPARRTPGSEFVVAGPMYPDSVKWPVNVENIQHLEPALHREFYNSQEFTLNITRSQMRACGYSPSVRLFEAAACGIPIITDEWAGLESLFLPGEEILVAREADDCLRYFRDVGSERRRAIGRAGRQRVLSSHTAEHRARELESYYDEVLAGQALRNGRRRKVAIRPIARSFSK